MNDLVCSPSFFISLDSNHGLVLLYLTDTSWLIALLIVAHLVSLLTSDGLEILPRCMFRVPCAYPPDMQMVHSEA